MYQSLDPARILSTASALHQRIAERFPGSSLSRVGDELVGICEASAATSEWLARPNWRLRSGIVAVLVVLVAVLAIGVRQVEVDTAAASLSDLVQGIEAAVNDAIFIGIAVFFLFTWETRRKRKRALGALHELRSMAHIIDMHQLTKDPERVMTPFELTRYLDYCSELLSLISKVAALYVQRFQDPVTLAAVNEVESLTSGLSRKIWQKIMILDRIVHPVAK